MLKELLDSPKCQFKLMVHYSNPQRFPQTSFQGSRAPQFEPFTKNETINPEKGEFEIKIDEAVTANEKLETQNKKNGRPKAKNKKSTLTIQKFSNHIKFIDYIPTHELITYRHLFAYGFYVE